MALCRDVIRLGAASVLDPADVCEDGASETRRRAGGLVGRNGVFSDGAAGRLRLRPSVEPSVATRTGGHVPSSAGRCNRDDASDRDCARMGCSAAGWNGALAVRPVRGFHRPSVLYLVSQCAAAAKLVCRERTSTGEQSICALRGIQSWLVRRAVRLSRRHRTVPDAENADGGLVHRVCAAGHSLECRRIGCHTRGACRGPGRSCG